MACTIARPAKNCSSVIHDFVVSVVTHVAPATPAATTAPATSTQTVVTSVTSFNSNGSTTCPPPKMMLPVR